MPVGPAPGGEEGAVPETPAIPSIDIRYQNSSGETLTDAGSKSIGSFVQNTSATFSIYVRNDGESGSILSISTNGIVVSGSGSLVSNPSSFGPVDIVQGATGITLNININSTVVGSKSISFEITSNDPTVTVFNYTFFFTVTEPLVQNPDIAIIYNGSQVQSSSIVSLGLFPLDGVDDISFQIFNYAVPNLVIPINGITITTMGSSESLVTNPSSSGAITIGFNASSTFTVRLDNSSLGEKTAVLLITSNDSDENPFIFTISYTTSKAFDLLVKQSAIEVSDDEVVSLGSFNQKSVIKKNISLSNTGISYGIRLLSIFSEGEVVLSRIPSLPFVLEPDEANVAEFVATFNSAVVGQKTAALRIQWEVSA